MSGDEQLETVGQLWLRHTTRHMPVRRLAVERFDIPSGNPAMASLLLGGVAAVVAAHLSEEGLERVRALAADPPTAQARPQIVMRFRVQSDTHGLERSKHSLLAAGPRLVLEVDVHSRFAEPQILGAFLAASRLSAGARASALTGIRRGLDIPAWVPDGLEVREVLAFHGRAPLLGATTRPSNGGVWDVGGDGEPDSIGMDELSWAYGILGIPSGTVPTKREVQKAFRTRIRLAHPDQGGNGSEAADIIEMLNVARAVVLTGTSE
ncbi:MAG: J domain-containing protein [Acidimicrobiia bacterium]|jgi:hypothetical protein|nr:J domain-containing protein [Acidimicrobiia bacterium]MBP8180773.1 J domain-containing protein [Acidimicrobiia bacterium]